MGCCASSARATYMDVVRRAFQNVTRSDAVLLAQACGRGGRVYSAPWTAGMQQAHGVLVKVVDADTLHVLCLTHAAVQCSAQPYPAATRDACTLLKVRIRGIDAPEMSKAYAPASVKRIWAEPARVQHRAGVRARWLATLYLGSAGVTPHPVYDDEAWQRAAWSDADDVLRRAARDRRQPPTGCPMVRLAWPAAAAGQEDTGPPLDAYGRVVADAYAWDGQHAAPTAAISLAHDALRRLYAKPYHPASKQPRGWTDDECSAYPLVPVVHKHTFLDDSGDGAA